MGQHRPMNIILKELAKKQWLVAIDRRNAILALAVIPNLVARSWRVRRGG